MSIPIPPASSNKTKKKSGKKAEATVSPETQIALNNWMSQSGGASTTTSKSSVITGTSIGTDPTTGKPIFNMNQQGQVVPIYPVGYEQSYIKKLKPEDRSALQGKMYNAGLYPQGYVPSNILTTADFDAVQKLVAVGEQRGIGDINAVLVLAKKDKNVATFLKTGGYAQTGQRVVTDTAEAASSLTNYFLDLFNDKPTKSEIKTYQNALNARERSSAGGLGQQERADIILSVANARLKSISANAIAGDINAQNILDNGGIGRRVRELRAAYEDNGIPVSEGTLYNQAGKSLRSTEAYDNILDEIANNAKTQWGQLGLNVDKNKSIKSQLQPYISVRAQIRGVPESQIKISDMTDVMNADGSIKKYAEYKMEQYKSPEYLSSDTFKSVKMNDNNALLRNLGVL